MDIKVSTFRDALGLLKPVVLRKPTLEVLRSILLKDGRAVATDMDTMVIVPVPGADIACLIPYEDAAKALDYVNGQDNLHIELKDGNVVMSWSDGSIQLASKNIEDFPIVPELVPTAVAEMDVDALIGGMNEVLSYASKEDDRPVLSGVTLVLGEHVAVAAGDGFRMAHKPLPLAFPKEEIIIVPRSSVNVLGLLWAKTPRTPPVGAASLIPVIMAKKRATVAIDGQNHLQVKFGNSAIALIKLIAGTPPDWLKLVPTQEPELVASVMAAQLDVAVRRVSSIAKEGNNVVRLVFNDGTATISAKVGGQHAEGKVKVLIGKGTTGRVGLNAKYLLNYLKGKEGFVTMTITQEGAPVSFKHQQHPSVLIMPMKVAWEEEAPTEEAAENPAEEAVVEAAKQ